MFVYLRLIWTDRARTHLITSSHTLTSHHTRLSLLIHRTGFTFMGGFHPLYLPSFPSILGKTNFHHQMSLSSYKCL